MMKWMKRMMVIGLFTLVFVGCSQSKQDLTHNQGNDHSDPDYTNVYISEINGDQLVIQPPVTDPDASYPVYEIYVNDETKVVGSKPSVQELNIDDDVEVWVNSSKEEKEIVQKILVK